MKNIFLKVLLLLCNVSFGLLLMAQTTSTGQYTSRTISATGVESTWVYNVVKNETKINGEQDDNGIIYIAGANDKLKVKSEGLSCQKQSSIYLSVPQNSAGSVSLSLYSTADSRWLQLYVNGQAGTVNQRLWSRNGTDLVKQGPQTYTFTAADLTLKDGQYYLHFKDNNTEMKISSFSITLTSGSYIEATPKSTDATLKELKYDGTMVPGFDAETTDYNVELPASYSGVPTVTATENDSKAKATVTQATAVPGDASVAVRAEDGTTTKTYTIHFTKAAANEPRITSFVVGGVTATIDQANKTITAELPIGSILTGLTPTINGDNIGSYTPTGAQDFTNPVTYTVSSASGGTATYTVTLTVAQPKSSNTSLGSLTIGGQTIPVVAGQTAYKVDVESGAAVPQVAATAADAKAVANCTQATSLSATATVTVTAEDGTIATYTISFNITIPKTDLTIHYPGVYEENSLKGGYDGTLTVFGGREYEVYYTARDASENATFNLTAQDKTQGITKNESRTGCEAIDGWFKATIYGTNSSSVSAKDEFSAGTSGREFKMQDGHQLQLHISGYDNFTIYAKDKKQDTSGKKPGDNLYFRVYIDGIEQDLQFDKDNYTLRRYAISTGEHLITIQSYQGENRLVGFSLRVADEPRVKYLSGNDTTQSVLVTRPMAPVTYYTKYNSKGTTTLEWDGTAPTGIALQTSGTDAVGDTLVLSGTPMCAAGVYPYRVVSYNQNNEATVTLKGKITVATKIEAKSDTIQDGFTNEAIDGFEFQYYAMSGDDITLTWDNTPAGICGLGNNGTYTISGTPTQAGTYKFAVTVAGGNTITGQLRVTVFDPGENPVLYLYKSTDIYEKDGVYQYLKSKNYNLIPRKAQAGLRESTQYAKYKWVLISEDVDANNEEIMALARGQQISMPVLNMKSFSYSESRLDWGDPDNGSLNNKGVTVVQESHPIIKALGKKRGDKIEIISEVTGKGLMPAAVDYQGTLCVATATTRGEEYTGDGVEETFLHEVPAALRGGKKYISFPLSIQSSQKLTADGKKLLDACVDYLTNAVTTIALPTLRIDALSIESQAATIYQDNDSIYLQLPEGTDLTALTPTVKLADPTTYYTIPMASEDGTVDFSASNLLPVTIRVSDYINVRNYVVVIVAREKEQTGIEEVYRVGDWVNIYDVQGRLVRTTNEDLRTLSLPKGMYLVSTPRGTMKLMK